MKVQLAEAGEFAAHGQDADGGDILDLAGHGVLRFFESGCMHPEWDNARAVCGQWRRETLLAWLARAAVKCGRLVGLSPN